jgi:DNA adenine methylase
MKNTTLKPSFGWVGGKSKLAKDIVDLMPEHRVYIEVFGGALNVLYAKEKPKANKKAEVVNDINGELINLHRVMQKRPQTLSLFLSKLLVSREIFNNIKNFSYKPRNDIERASYYFYLISQSFGAKGESFAMSAKSKKPKNIYKDFTKWSERLKGVVIENMSFERLLKEYDKEDAFFYCDPPYVSTESYYKNIGSFGKNEHILLNDKLKNLKGKFLLSYNDCELIRELYKDFKIIKSKEINYLLGQNMHNKKKSVQEIFIMNY